MAYAFESATILATATESGVIAVPERKAERLVIETPTALTHEVTLYGSINGGISYKAIYSAGSPVVLAANGIHTVTPTKVDHIKFVSAGAEASDRVFMVKLA